MTTGIVPTRFTKGYKYKFSILAAIVFPCLCRLALQVSGYENELIWYFAALLTGAAIGYLIDSLAENWQQSLSKVEKSIADWQNRYKNKGYVTHAMRPCLRKSIPLYSLLDSATGQIAEANPCACASYGCSLEQLQQVHISAITSLSKEGFDHEFSEAQSQGRQKLFQTHTMATGAERDVEVFYQSIQIESTTTIFLVVGPERNKKTLKVIISICAHCKQIRVETGEWSLIEEYIQHYTDVTFSHGLCPSCASQHYPAFYEMQNN